MNTETKTSIAELWAELQWQTDDVKQVVRKELLERCKIFRGHFDKLENRIRFGITVFQTETVSMTTPEGHGMPLNANDLMELSAICAFWAWEIGQREKEAAI